MEKAYYCFSKLTVYYIRLWIIGSTIKNKHIQRYAADFILMTLRYMLCKSFFHPLENINIEQQIVLQYIHYNKTNTHCCESVSVQ